MSASSNQFSAGQLFYAVSLSAASTALFGFWGLPIAFFVALVWWQILCGAQREAKANPDLTFPISAKESSSEAVRPAFLKVELAIVLLISAILLGLLVPARSDTDPMRHAEISMQVVAKAVAEYQLRHGAYPPPILFDEFGKPMHSWRALILHELGEQKLADAYRFDEPWNGPNNSELAKYRPWHYQTYYQGSKVGGQTSSLHLFEVGAEVMVAEQEQVCTNWLEPRALQLEEWNERNCVPNLEEGFWRRGFFSSTHRGRLLANAQRAWVVHADQPFNARELSGTDGVIGHAYRQFHLSNALRLGAFLLIALYPIRWLRAIRQAEFC